MVWIGWCRVSGWWNGGLCFGHYLGKLPSSPFAVHVLPNWLETNVISTGRDHIPLVFWQLHPPAPIWSLWFDILRPLERLLANSGTWQVPIFQGYGLRCKSYQLVSKQLHFCPSVVLSGT